MSHRTQITLSDEEYASLKRESERTGPGLAELVRRALRNTYGSMDPSARAVAVRRSFGAWRTCEDSGEAYVERLRRGMAGRLDSP
jgi:hypothetical protein